MRRGALASAFVALVALLCVPAGVRARTLTMADMPKLVELTAAQLAPDGRSIAVVVGRADYDRDRMLHEIDLVDVASGAHRSLTRGHENASSPAWSPQGDRLAFLAEHDGHAQIYVMPMNGGDPWRVTDAPTGVEQFAWRPDGRALAYVSIDDEQHRNGPDKYRDAFRIANNDYLARGPALPGHLYVVAVDGGAARRLTRGTWSILVGESASTLSWSHDGKSVAFARSANAILDTEDFSTVWMVDVASGAITHLTSHTQYERDPQFSPDGVHVGYTYAEGDTQINPIELYITEPGKGIGENVTRAVDRAVADFAWAPDGAAAYVAARDGVHSAIFRIPNGEPAQRIDVGGLSVESPLAGAVGKDGAIAFVGSGPTQPPEVYVAAQGAPARKLTDYNAPIAHLDLNHSEELAYDGPNGFREDAVVTYPAGYVKGHAYPLVVVIHGGPTSASLLAFFDRIQMLAAHGWFVLQPNYRGSDNLGRTYQRAILHDVVDGPGRDIMAAVDALRAHESIDPARIGVSGWSYGGIMTSWMITHYHIWRAAMSGAGVHDWVVDYSLADDLSEDRVLFRSGPFSGGDTASWRTASPLTYARQITTPLLMLSDVGDARVPIPESYELFRALQDLHKPVEFYAYPIDGHYPDDPVRADDVLRRWVNWFAVHF